MPVDVAAATLIASPDLSSGMGIQMHLMALSSSELSG